MTKLSFSIPWTNMLKLFPLEAFINTFIICHTGKFWRLSIPPLSWGWCLIFHRSHQVAAFSTSVLIKNANWTQMCLKYTQDSQDIPLNYGEKINSKTISGYFRPGGAPTFFSGWLSTGQQSQFLFPWRHSCRWSSSHSLASSHPLKCLHFTLTWVICFLYRSRFCTV